MDEFNNNEKRNFEEESFADNTPSADPYNNPAPYNNPDPYNQPVKNSKPSGQQNYNYNYQNEQQIPPDYDPYKQPYDPYRQPFNQHYPTGAATASMVFGILGLICAATMMNYMLLIPMIFPVLGLIFGIYFKTRHYPVGKASSTAGIVTSIVAIVITIGVFILALFLVLNYMPEMLQIIKDMDPELYELYYEMFHDVYPEWFEGISALFAGLFR